MKTLEEPLNRIKEASASWSMMSSPWPGLSLVIFYLLFVTVIGPTVTKNRKPLNITGIIVMYNAAQVISSTWWLVKLISNTDALRYLWQSVFQETFVIQEKIELQMDELNHIYLIMKYTEFLDTVFFILRQKWNQVSFLHVYHHANMAVLTWFYQKHFWGHNAIVVAGVNTFIHVLMYSYYLLSALGPAVKPYLWWKPYITRLQITQFVFLLSYVVVLWIKGCEAQKMFMVSTFLNTMIFLLLFINFYKTTYRKKLKTT